MSLTLKQTPLTCITRRKIVTNNSYLNAFSPTLLKGVHFRSLMYKNEQVQADKNWRYFHKTLYIKKLIYWHTIGKRLSTNEFFKTKKETS